MSDTVDHSIRLAIVGTEGSGKTVLLATLAKYLGRSAAEGVSLQPLSTETERFVGSHWRTLVEGNWPASTELPVALHWRLSWRSEMPRECRIEAVDASGADWRKVFAERAPDIEPSLPEPLSSLRQHFDAADLVICLVNLADFVGEPDPEKQLENQLLVSSVLRQARASSNRPTVLLFSQADLYCQSVLPRFENHWGKVAVRYLPSVSAAHLAPGVVPMRVVAAVDKLRVGTRDDGRPQRVPAPGFHSAGFDGLMKWMTEQVDAIMAARRAEQERRKAARKERLEREQGERVLYALLFVLGGVALFWWWTMPPAPRDLRVERPAPFGTSTSLMHDLTARINFGRLRDEVSIRNDSGKPIRNAVLTLLVERSGDESRNEVLLTPPRNWRPGETRTWRDETGFTRTSRVKVRVDDIEFGP